jgi:hypothetical protein
MATARRRTWPTSNRTGTEKRHSPKFTNEREALMPWFEVKLTRTKLVRLQEDATVEVEAKDKDDARRKAGRMVETDHHCNIHWEEWPDRLDEEEEDYEVEEVDELDPEDMELTFRERVAALLRGHTPDELAAAVAELRKGQDADETVYIGPG